MLPKHRPPPSPIHELLPTYIQVKVFHLNTVYMTLVKVHSLLFSNEVWKF